MMKVLLISLASSTTRRKNAVAILKRYGISYDIIDAVDGRLGTDPLLQRYDETGFIRHKGRKALAGELGCYASHILAWQQVIKLDQPVVILEDDFILQDDFCTLIEIAKLWMHKHHFIRLEPWQTKLFYSVAQQNEVKLVKFLKVPQCTTGYFISPQCAQAFLSASNKMILPVDVFIRNTYLHRQAIYGLYPAPVRPGGDKNSTIGCRKQKVTQPLVRMKKLITRLYSSFLCALVNIISR
ncbi:glycosyltransferase family 25 protein [Photobacterium kishitanii]|uniref:Glycosyltransferase n=1 Tax=Photobacterium kishitanii TaxID=318456 RepID=A0AAX0YUL5_9GAMM|nr:glycosyltransferase family 25 protein [Photobacterium kishitanii]PSX18704.1 glycosyltransferase [Photobacterium kishitanii]PSX27419.1 glycosyltransferase [Photobacterium kishitanii]PSX33007.1 glycosyltransferase [Photobacterium kishitanii]PSX44553.1 glycosyltransferase [Photobacterium kishitanii]